MRARRVILLALAFATACTSAKNPVCGAGSTQQGQACVAIDAATPVDAAPPVTTSRFWIFAPPKIAASQAVRNRIVVVGTQLDGAPALDTLLLSFDRPGAGTFTSSAVRLGPLGAHTYFSACDESIPGCLGPVSLTVALASAPNVPLAQVNIEIVDPLEVNPARACLAGGNILILNGNDQIFTGATTITGATWTIDSVSQNTITMHVTPQGAASSWRLIFDAQKYSPLFVPDLYDNAQDAVTVQADHPGMDISGFGHQCTTITGNFVVEDYSVNNSGAQNVTISFEQHCEGSTTTALTGCLHYQP